MDDMQTLYKLPDYYKIIINHLVNTDLEVRLLDEIMHKNNAHSILDLACGVGRHSIPLSKLGYSVTGIDFSQYQIAKAKEDALHEGASAKFLLADANSFSFPDRFDAAMCMWTTLGEEPIQYRKVIPNVHRILRNDGIFIIDNRSWEYIPESREEFISNRIEKDGALIESMLHDRYTENFRVRDSTYIINGQEYNDLCITHLLKEEDWIRELREGRFKDFDVYHDREFKRAAKPRHVTIVAHK